jgi:pilus assembly protein CpaB
VARTIAATSAASTRNRGLLMLAAVFGILSAMLMFAFLNSRGGGGSSVNSALSPSAGAESVVVVTRDIQVGDKITSDMLTMKSLPSSAVLPGHVTKSEDLVGKVATAPMFTGEQVIDAKTTTFEGQNTLSYKVPEGMRAVALQVPNEGWITGGLPQPGDRIDFLAVVALTRTDPLTGQEKPDVVSGIIAQNVEVLAMSQKLVKTVPKVDTSSAGGSSAPLAVATDAKPLGDGATYEKAISVTLALPPDLAAKVSLVDAMKKDVGQWRLLVRQKGDTTDISGATQWTYDDLFSTTKKK